MMKLYKSSFVQWLGYLALTEETGVQFPYGENAFLFHIILQKILILLLQLVLIILIIDIKYEPTFGHKLN